MSDEKDQITSFTLRLPEVLRNQLVVQASAKRRSLNSHIQSILEGHLVESGFAGHKLVSQSGRTFEVVFQADDIPGQRDGVMGYFYLKEIKFAKERAHFMIGLEQDLVEDWHLDNPVEAIEQIGLALLQFYNRRFEIDHIKWPHPKGIQDYDGYRLLGWSDVQGVHGLNHFLDLLRTNAWEDKLVQDGEKSQDIRRGRNPAALY